MTMIDPETVVRALKRRASKELDGACANVLRHDAVAIVRGVAKRAATKKTPKRKKPR